MDNETVAAVLKEAQRFWLKWRNQVPSRDSEQWDELSSEAGRGAGGGADCELVHG